MPYRYSPEFRRKVLDLLAAGRAVGAYAGGWGWFRLETCVGRARPDGG